MLKTRTILNKLASLEATLVWNSAHSLTYSLTGVKCRATRVAKNTPCTTSTFWSKWLYKLNPSVRHLNTKTTSKLFVTGYIWNCGGTTSKSGEKHSCQDLLGLSPLSTLYDVIPRRRFLRITSWSQTKLRRWCWWWGWWLWEWKQACEPRII